MTPRQVPSNRRRCRASRRWATTPNAALHATTWQRQRITFSPRTPKDELERDASKVRFVADIWGQAAEERDMKKTLPLLLLIIALAFVILGRGTASSQDKQDKYSLKVPGGLAFSDFKG
jgi:hypothetical protein